MIIYWFQTTSLKLPWGHLDKIALCVWFCGMWFRLLLYKTPVQHGVQLPIKRSLDLLIMAVLELTVNGTRFLDYKSTPQPYNRSRTTIFPWSAAVCGLCCGTSSSSWLNPVREPLQEAGLHALQKRLQLRNLLPLHIKYGIRMNYTKQLLIWHAIIGKRIFQYTCFLFERPVTPHVGNVWGFTWD